MKIPALITTRELALTFTIILLSLFQTSCSSNDSNTNSNLNDVVGSWKYPKSGMIDSSLRVFKITFKNDGALTYVKYVDNNLEDSISGMWTIKSSALHISLADSTNYSKDWPSANPGQLSLPRVSSIELTYSSEKLLDSANGYEYERVK